MFLDSRDDTVARNNRRLIASFVTIRSFRVSLSRVRVYEVGKRSNEYLLARKSRQVETQPVGNISLAHLKQKRNTGLGLFFLICKLIIN